MGRGAQCGGGKADGAAEDRQWLLADGQWHSNGSGISFEERTARCLLYPGYVDGISMRRAVAKIDLDPHPVVVRYFKAAGLFSPGC